MWIFLLRVWKGILFIFAFSPASTIAFLKEVSFIETLHFRTSRDSIMQESFITNKNRLNSSRGMHVNTLWLNKPAYMHVTPFIKCKRRQNIAGIKRNLFGFVPGNKWFCLLESCFWSWPFEGQGLCASDLHTRCVFLRSKSWKMAWEKLRTKAWPCKAATSAFRI